MKDKQIIFCFSDNNDLLEISNRIENVFNVDLNINYIKLIKKLMETINNKKKVYMVTELSVKGELFALFSKVLNKNIEYSIWIDEVKNKTIVEKFVEYISVYYSKSLITRSNQMKFSLNKEYSKRIFVIYPWVRKKKYNYNKFSYKIFTNSDLILPKNWKRVDILRDADLSIIKLKNKVLMFKLPKIILKSIEKRIPTVIIYHKPKTVNKIFKYVKNIYVLKSESELNFNDLEYWANQSYKFKIPKKLRFNYNLSKFKKILK